MLLKNPFGLRDAWRIAAALGVHWRFVQSIDFEGIVGMGFPEMSSTGATPIYDNIMNQAKLKRNEFAFYVAKGSPVGATSIYPDRYQLMLTAHHTP